MALSELIKYEGDNSTFIWKYPNEDFNCMTELVVHESQEVIFFANGQAADTFGPGRYKLDAKNIPILTNLINIVTGVSVFHCEVYFINKTVQMGIKWGTDSKIRFVEPTLGVPVEIGASGEMNLAVSDGRKLLLSIVGTMNGIAWSDEGSGFTRSLQSSFRPLIVTSVKSNLSSAIIQNNIDIVEIDQHLVELSNTLRDSLTADFENYGLTIPQFFLTTVVLPEEDPNFRKLKELHTISLQKSMLKAEADVRITQAQSKADYMTAEAMADEKITIAKRGAELEAQTTETEIAKREAERRLIKAQTDAQIAQMTGLAEATVMQAKGYNQKDVLQAEVQKAYAEGIGNMGPTVASGGGNSIIGDMVGLGVGMAAANVIAPQLGNMFQGINNPSTQMGILGTTWMCSCGNQATGNFCNICGSKKPQMTLSDTWDCECGQKGIVGNFCNNCGKRRG